MSPMRSSGADSARNRNADAERLSSHSPDRQAPEPSLHDLEIVKPPVAKTLASITQRSRKVPEIIAVTKYDDQQMSPKDVVLPLSSKNISPLHNDDLVAVEQTQNQRPSGFERVKNFIQRGFHLVMSEVGLVILLIVYSLIGAAVFVVIEGRAEDKAIAALQDQKSVYEMARKNFLDDVLNLTRCDGERRQNIVDNLQRYLSEYEIFPVEISDSHLNATLESSKPKKQWTFSGALFYCGTVFTTVGYGNIVPTTDTGRIVTMIYAVLGIPLCLVVLSKLGKSLTRAIKFLWSFVRRFYYTGSCFRIRKRAVLRKLSLGEKLRLRLRRRGASLSRKALNEMFVPYDVDDKFNLPPVIAIIIAFLYIFLGALMYSLWENWSFLEAFYFTFTSLATIGFGDVLPSHQKFFIAAAAYLLIGLSLIAMVINVVMETVSETITKATDQVIQVGNEVKERIIRVTPVGRLMSAPCPPPPPSSSLLPLFPPGTRLDQLITNDYYSAARRHSI